MRNLHCCQDRRQQLLLPVELGDVTHFAVDCDGGVLFVAGSGLGVAAYRTADCEVGTEQGIVKMLASGPRSRGADTSRCRRRRRSAATAMLLPFHRCPPSLPSPHRPAHTDVVVC